MSFVNELFPIPISKKSLGGPRMNLAVTESPDSGAQERSDRWPAYRWEYDAGIGMRKNASGVVVGLDEAQKHFLAVGPKNSFPFEDPRDFTSHADGRTAPTQTGTLDQVIGVGDGATISYQLTKSYTFGGRTYVRNIIKPQTGTVVVAFGTTVLTVGTHYTVDYSTGLLLFLAGSTPGNGVVIRASYKFWVPVLHAGDFSFKVSYDAIDAGRVPSMPLIEDVSLSAITPEFPYCGGGDTVTMTSSLLYDYNMGRSVFFSPNADGHSLLLPDINELPFGGPIFSFANIATVATKTITFRNRSTGASEFTLPVLKAAEVFVRKDLAGLRKWHAIGN